MRRLLIFLHLFFCCVAFAEDVDLQSMSYNEIVDFISNAPLPVSLRLADKYDLPAEDYLMQAYEGQLPTWRSMPDASVFLSYCTSRTVMIERDLMKYLPMVGIESKTNASNDLSDLSLDELASLSEKICMEMMSRGDWQEVEVPVGTYQIGKQIPAGHWVISCAPHSYCYVDIGSEVEANGKDIVYGSHGYYHVAMAGTNSGISNRGYPSSFDIVLKDGMYISIEHAFVTFTPYTGDPGFTFK